MTRATLSNIQKPAQYQGAYFASGPDNPYNMHTPDGQEDIRWLF